MRPDFSIRHTIDQIADQQKLQLPSSIEAGSVVTTLGMAKSGLGLAVLPEYVNPDGVGA